MPTTKNGVRRICAIHQMISANPYKLTKFDIQRRLEDYIGDDISMSSIEKDFFSLKMDFDVEIRYSKFHKGYYIQNDNPFLFMENLFSYLGINDFHLIKQVVNACKTIS